MIERVEQLRSHAEGEIAAASSAQALQELRVRHLGRRAPLPQLLRGVAQLPAEQRAAVGAAANEARNALEALLEQRAAELRSAELSGLLEGDRVDVTLPGAPPQPIGRLHVLSATRRELEDIFLGLGFTVVEGPEVETVHYNFDALNHSPTHPARERSDTFYLASSGQDDEGARRPRGVAAPYSHLADADPRDGEPPAAPVCRDPRARLPARLRRHPYASVPPDRGPGRRRGHHARRPQGHAARVRARGLRRRARGPPASA